MAQAARDRSVERRAAWNRYNERTRSVRRQVARAGKDRRGWMQVAVGVLSVELAQQCDSWDGEHLRDGDVRLWHAAIVEAIRDLLCTPLRGRRHEHAYERQHEAWEWLMGEYLDIVADAIGLDPGGVRRRVKAVLSKGAPCWRVWG